MLQNQISILLSPSDQPRKFALLFNKVKNYCYYLTSGLPLTCLWQRVNHLTPVHFS